ncbi:MAG: hypothetical protein IJQ93_04180 [Bacteroidales bacterium]|nr:hypothetical protein [Bacteroidales bacterium]
MRKLQSFFVMTAVVLAGCNGAEPDNKNQETQVEDEIKAEVINLYDSGVSDDAATLTGTLNILEGNVSETINAYFCYSSTDGTAKDLASSGTRVPAKEIAGGRIRDKSLFQAVLSDLSPKSPYWYVPVVVINGTEFLGSVAKFETKASYEVYVDLGLGIYWAKANYGADRPEEPGYYYAWGETEPKGAYTWDNYFWGTKDALSKYTTNRSYSSYVPDDIVILEKDDDVIRSKMKGKWRMPTKEELGKLFGRTLTFKTVNGVDGVEISTTVASGKLFIPFAGRRYGANAAIDNSNISYLWSSSLNESNNNNAWARNTQKLSSGSISSNATDMMRYMALNIRPVYDPNLE